MISVTIRIIYLKSPYIKVMKNEKNTTLLIFIEVK